MDIDHPEIPCLQAVFEAAKSFGLTDAEIWRAFDETLGAGLDEELDDLTAELARGILVKVRRASGGEDRSPALVTGRE